MKTIVIPDIHQDLYTLNSIMDSKNLQDADEVIFLGDYFDSFEHDELTVQMCEFLNQNMRNPNYIFLLGNHDVHYLTNVRQYICSGFSLEKKKKIQDTLDVSAFLNCARPLYFNAYDDFTNKDRRFLYSHAGLHPNFLSPYFDHIINNGDAGDATMEYFEAMSNHLMDSLKNNFFDPMFGAGYDRGGNQAHGGITWLDWYSFVPIEEFRQVVGHSRMTNVEWNSGNCNLDTGLKYYMQITSGEHFEIKISERLR